MRFILGLNHFATPADWFANKDAIIAEIEMIYFLRGENFDSANTFLWLKQVVEICQLCQRL